LSSRGIWRVDIGYHYPGVVRFVDASKTTGDQTGLGWDSACQYLQDALDEAQTVNYKKIGSDPFNSLKIDGDGNQQVDIDMGPYEYQGP